MDMNEFNKKIIEEFRANQGKVAGQFQGAPMVLMDHPPSAGELIHALAPPPPSAGGGGDCPPGLRCRGLRLSSAPPANGGDKAPAVALRLNFALNSATVDQASEATLREIAAALTSEQLGQYNFRIEGHTDALGNDGYNLQLSRRRAESVRDELIRVYKVPANRLTAVGYGKTRPLDPADPMNPNNRRVQIVNLGS